ncbi:hypothetical protein ACFLVH_02690 [Chloroflexota bacterium]
MPILVRIMADLDNCTNQDKKDAYTYPDLKVKATTEGADIKGYLDPGVIKSDSCLLTIGQTSGYQIVWTEDYPAENNS